MRKSRVKDLAGQRFGKLTVVELAPKKKSWTMWKCRCDCGNDHVTYSTHLVRGNVTSCGCDMIKKGSNHVQWAGYGEISGRRWNAIRRMNFGGKRLSRLDIPFDIDIRYAWVLFLKQDRKCALSGIPLHFAETCSDDFTASLDRIDNTRGYEEGNVQWIHKDINRMKNVFSQDYFIDTCRKIAATAEPKLLIAQDEYTYYLNEEDWERFTKALDEPPLINEKLRKAMKGQE